MCLFDLCGCIWVFSSGRGRSGRAAHEWIQLGAEFVDVDPRGVGEAGLRREYAFARAYAAVHAYVIAH